MCILKFWLNNKHIWFNCSETDNKIVKDLFEKYIDDDRMLMNEEKVLLYDQFSRHYYRGEQAKHITMYYTIKAVDIIERKMPANILSRYPSSLWVWMMMPFRHRGKLIDRLRIIEMCWVKLELSKTCDTMVDNNNIEYDTIKRFIKASYLSLPRDINIAQYDSFSFHKEKLEYTHYKHILDNSFILPTINSRTHTIYKTIKNNISKYIPDYSGKKVLLMLSGGVDSMVCMHVLMQIPDLQYSVCHINYKNRDEDSDDEETFIQKWCMYHGIQLFVKSFPEIQRTPCMSHGLRNVYETYTKNAKMEFTKQFDYVILGHNKDDITENILTNILKKHKLGKHLTGMSILSNDCNTFRPMLNISKTDIFEYAHSFKIPYFKNSTPEWSQRGKIRDGVIPAINTWNCGFSESLSYLADHIADLDTVKDMYVDNFIKQNYDSEKQVLYLEKESKHMPKVVWCDIIVRITGQTISKNSMEHFYTKIYNMLHNNKEVNRINLNKNLYAVCFDNGNYIGFRKN